MLCPWDDNDLLIVAKKTPVPDTETAGVGGEGVRDSQNNVGYCCYSWLPSGT